MLAQLREEFGKLRYVANTDCEDQLAGRLWPAMGYDSYVIHIIKGRKFNHKILKSVAYKLVILSSLVNTEGKRFSVYIAI